MSLSALPITHGECAREPWSTVQDVVIMHEPPTHVPAQVTPHPPQLFVSVPIVSVQLPLQQLRPPHDLPHMPQLFGSLVMSTHVLLQQVLSSPRQPPLHPPPPVSAVVPVSCWLPVSF